jgi:hypothetical protein
MIIYLVFQILEDDSLEFKKAFRKESKAFTYAIDESAETLPHIVLETELE